MQLWSCAIRAEQRQRRAILIGVLLGLLALAAGAGSSERFYSERLGISVVAPGFHSGGGNLVPVW